MQNDNSDGAAFALPVRYFEKREQQAPSAANATRQQDFSGGAAFAEPTPHYLLNADEVQELRARAAQLQAQLDGLEANNAPWSARNRLRAELDAIRTRLAAAERARDQQRERETGIGRDDAPPAVNSAPGERTRRAFAAQGKRAEVMQGAFGPVVMVF